jgi:hypothetical protein
MHHLISTFSPIRCVPTLTFSSSWPTSSRVGIGGAKPTAEAAWEALSLAADWQDNALSRPRPSGRFARVDVPSGSVRASHP